MKNQFSKFWLIVAIFVIGIAAAGASDRAETLRAINWVENPDNHARVGRFGELGPYQFRPATWKMHSQKPFNLAMQRAEADEVAILHYEWIKRTFEVAGVEVNAFNVALAWNCGVETVLRGRAPAVSYNYAERVTNLVEVLKEGEQGQNEQETLAVESESEENSEENAGGLRFRVLLNTPTFVIAGR